MGQSVRYEVSPDQPRHLYDYNGWGEAELLECMETWTRPTLSTILGQPETVEEMDRYLSVGELLAYERKVRERSGRQAAEESLRSTRNKWRLWAKSKGIDHVKDLVDAISRLAGASDLSYSAKETLISKTADFLLIVDGENLGRFDDEVLDKVMSMLPDAYEAACDAAEALRGRNKQKAEVDEAIAWVQEHGSPRLRKALDAKLLSVSLGAYRDERLAHDLPNGWQWEPQDHTFKQIVNPSEDALDALLIVRERDPHANLWFEATTRTPIIRSTFLGRSIYAKADDILDAWRGERGATRGGEAF